MPSTYQLYLYTPSFAAAAAAIVVFAILTVAHGYRMATTRTWFCIPFFIGGLCKSSPPPLILIRANNFQSKP